MNVWRLLGIGMLVVGTVCLIGMDQFSAHAKKPEDPKKQPDDKKKQVDDKKKQPEQPEKKPEVKQPEVAKGGTALTYMAFNKGAKPFYQKQYTKTKQEMKVMGQVVVQTQEQTFMILWTPKDKDKDGNFVVSQKIVGVKMEINIGGNKISYDSTSTAKQKNPMTDFFDQLTKQELTFTVKSDLSKVVSIDGRDKFITGLSEINPQMQTLLKAILSEKALTRMAEPTWYAFPPGAKAGDKGIEASYPEKKTWEGSSDLDLGPIGKYKTDFTFTYKERKDNKDIIGIGSKLTYTAPEASAKSGLPFIIHEAKLSADAGTGETVFNVEKGRFDSTKLGMKLTGTLTIEVGNQKTNVELTQDQTAESTALDDLPADWKTK